MTDIQTVNSIWLVYIIHCSDGSLYTGITKNIANRLSKHENGTGAKYTKGRGPFQIVFTEKFSDRAQATKREIQIKKISKQKKIQLINSKSKRLIK